MLASFGVVLNRGTQIKTSAYQKEERLYMSIKISYDLTVVRIEQSNHGRFDR